jgi:dihydrodipicolinate synthase/N-acetylneuraminate lyase
VRGPEILSALTTPFDESGQIVTAAFDANLHRLEPDVDGVFVAGTTGEFLALDPAEHLDLVSRSLAVFGADRVVVHIGSPSLRQSLVLATAGAAAGARRFAALTPYYLAATPVGCGRFFAALRAELAGAELYGYLFPDVAVTTVLPGEIQPMLDAGIDGIKTSGSASRLVADYLAAAPAGFKLWSGNDADLPNVMAAGGTGTVSGVSSVCPRPWAAFREAYVGGDQAALEAAQARITTLVPVLGPSIANLKYGLGVVGSGLGAGPCRMSIDPPAADTERLITEAIQAAA